MSERTLVEARTLDISYEIGAEVYSDGNVSARAAGWVTPRDADSLAIYSKTMLDQHDRAEAEALHALALEVAPSAAEEPAGYGFVGTVVIDGVEHDVIAREGDGRRIYQAFSRTEGLSSWPARTLAQLLNRGTFTPRADA